MATCAERIEHEYKSRMDDLYKLWNAYIDGTEEVEGLGNLYEYGLSFDYVPVGTFTDMGRGFFRYQLSWGGPQDEFRIYANQNGFYNWSISRIEYWFLDWFDGAHIVLRGSDFDFMVELLTEFFMAGGMFDSEYDKNPDDDIIEDEQEEDEDYEDEEEENEDEYV